jgi:hypothetical protein
MTGKIKYTLLLLLLSFPSFAQREKETDWGASMTVEAEKDLSRKLSLGIEEEIRLSTNNSFDRNITSVGLDYALINKKLKIGAYYAFIYLSNDDHLYEPRHRYHVNLSYKETLSSFTLSWRGRYQVTYRDENRGEYKINPKQVMKNKLEVEYSIWGSPWKPYISCDFSTLLNDPVRGYELTRLRFQGGTSWRLNKTTYLDFHFRWDEYIRYKEPRLLSLGATYKIKF